MISEDNQATANPQRVHIETWGCQMNVADSEKMLSLMKDDQYQPADGPENADLIILNTCHIREKARHKVVSRLGRLRELKEQNPNLTIALAGCVAQAEGKKLAQELETVDVVVGPGKLDQLPELVANHKTDGSKHLALGFQKPEMVEANKPSLDKLRQAQPSLDGKNEVSRFVNIQQGCDNFCTFCVVPFTRGREISDTPDEIAAKTESLVNQGVHEITLLGQNVNSYGLDLVKRGKMPKTENGPFVDLLERIALIPGLKRLRFTTSNPHDFTLPLAKLMAKQPKLGKYIHLPVQSGSDHMLEVMKRKVTVKDYWQRVQWLREAIPDIAISTDLIVGFPGESEEDFQATYDLVEKLRYSFIFAFKYSPRKGTAAIRFKDQVPESVKTERLARLNKLQNSITLELNAEEVGKTRDVLFLYESKKEPGIYYGRTEHFRLVRVPSASDISGQELAVHIDGSNKTALTGVLIN